MPNDMHRSNNWKKNYRAIKNVSGTIPWKAEIWDLFNPIGKYTRCA